MRTYHILAYLICLGLFLPLASCQSGTTAPVTALNQTTDTMPSKADILDFAGELMDQYEAAAKPYFVALDSVWADIELEEGEEMSSLDPFEESKKWNHAGIQAMTVASPSFVKKFTQRVDSIFDMGQNWNFGSAFLGSDVGIGMERLEFPLELHETIQFSQDHNSATFRMYLISDHDNYPAGAQVLITCSRIGQVWKLEDARMVAD